MYEFNIDLPGAIPAAADEIADGPADNDEASAVPQEWDLDEDAVKEEPIAPASPPIAPDEPAADHPA